MHLLVNHFRKVIIGEKKKKAINVLITFSLSHKSDVEIFLK